MWVAPKLKNADGTLAREKRSLVSKKGEELGR
jgi:hypothetical protein